MANKTEVIKEGEKYFKSIPTIGKKEISKEEYEIELRRNDYRILVKTNYKGLVTDFLKKFEAVKKRFKNEAEATSALYKLIGNELALIGSFETRAKEFSKFYSDTNYTEYLNRSNGKGKGFDLKDHQFEFEYLRLTCGYYNGNPDRIESRNAAFVVARYFEFKKVLMEHLEELDLQYKDGLHKKNFEELADTKYQLEQLDNEIGGLKEIKHKIILLNKRKDKVEKCISDYVLKPISEKRQKLIDAAEQFLKGIEERIDKLKNSGKRTDVNAKKEIETFEDLFNDKSVINGCVQVLRDVKPPLIGTENNYMGKSKSAFCVWINELERMSFFKAQTDRNIYAKVLTNYFTNFSIEGSTFAKANPRAENKYRNDFRTMISKIKVAQLSQSEQKGNLGK